MYSCMKKKLVKGEMVKGKGSIESERTEQKTELKGDNVVIGLDCDTPLSVVDKSVVCSLTPSFSSILLIRKIESRVS